MMSMNNAWVVGWFKYFLNNSDFKNFFGRVYIIIIRLVLLLMDTLLPFLDDMSRHFLG